jgi:hypothetical protein
MHLGEVYRGFARAQWRWYARITERVLRAIGLDEADVEDWRRATTIAGEFFWSDSDTTTLQKG